MNKFITFALFSALVLAIYKVEAAEPEPQNVIDQIKDVMTITSKLTNSIKQLLGAKKPLSKDIQEKLKELGGNLGDTEGQLAEQMALLGDELGIPKPPPPPKQ